ncbi:hypothetical protein DM872_26560 [Pseudomonas taiwanensis]|uniref:ATP-binding domain-containing protein n=1 Tax=Pseudomonas taiwanensis TaxID=470150 RepID=UPI0015BB1AD2|nr:ATP-binding domain-containing protein [Pseudomonas taiwanensis]NWL80418.1 hypothetical protein [Pseudomonas taiwanensis]
MRLPKLRQLTEEQKQIYLYAPLDSHVLVQGPPGTGKTLIACLRAIELQKRKVPVVLGMFNQVLMTYSSNAGVDAPIPSQTVHSWFREWWRASGLPPHPGASGRIAVQVPYEEKDSAKEVGVYWCSNEWRPWETRRGVWMVDSEVYFRNPDAFEKWTLWPEPPVIDDNKNRIDWGEVSRHLINNDELIGDSLLNLGVLLVDEGQDFPPAFYAFLRVLSALGRMRKVSNPLQCFVLADENQQLTEENSTIEQIYTELKIIEKNRYLLLDNFRNSREIAELARRFFADVGVLPRLPTRTSEKPLYEICADRSVIVERILTWIVNNPLKEVGVVVFEEGTREDLVDRLRGVVRRIKGRVITVQTYSWSSRRQNPANKLVFDGADVVTVLNMQSCKGLEFDAVFIVDSQEAAIGIYGADKYKMQMFVAVSRARDWVSLLDAGPRAGHGVYQEILPGEEYLSRENSTLPSHIEFSVTPDGLHSADKNPQSPDWFIEIERLARKLRLPLIDKRKRGGAVWVTAGHEHANLLESLGFKYKADRGEWWRK